MSSLGSEAFEGPEPDDRKLSRPVLRGPAPSNGAGYSVDDVGNLRACGIFAEHRDQSVPFDQSLKDLQSAVDSLETVLALLDKEGVIDPKRVGLTGLSWGSDVTQYAISHSRAFAVASVSGPSVHDPCFYFIGGKVWREQFARYGIPGLPGEDSSTWAQWSAALNYRSIAAPLLIQASSSEYHAALQLVTTLKEAHKPVELIIYLDESHEKKDPAHKLTVNVRNVDWFRFWFKVEEDPDPAKADQYKRWRELRKLEKGNETR